MRQVHPDHVFEIAFEGIQSLAAPQIRRRPAVSAHEPLAPRQAEQEANTLDDLKDMLAAYG